MLWNHEYPLVLATVRPILNGANCGAQSAVHVEPQMSDLLVYLVQNRDRVVSKDDLIASVWGGRIVSESTLTSRINAARTAVGDSGRKQQLIRTIPRKGLRFMGALHTQVDDNQPAQATDPPSDQIRDVSRPALLLPDRPAITALPFTNMSGDPKQGIFFRWNQQGRHHGAVQAALVLRDRSQLFIHLQRQGRAHEAGRRGTRGRLCGRGQHAQKP